MKPKIIIDGFELGMVEDPTLPIRNGFNLGVGLDIHKEPGYLQVSQRLDLMTEAASPNDITELIQWLVKYGSLAYGLGAGNSGRIYSYNYTAWSLAHTDANGGYSNGMKEYNGNLHWASNTKLGKFDGVSTWTDSFQTFKEGDNKWHPMAIYMGKLMIGDGRYIATLDSDDTWDDDALILPAGYRVRDIKVYGDRLVIGTWRGTNIYDHWEANLFTWDGVATQPEDIFTVKEAGIHALHPWRNVLIVFAGTDGNVYAFNGAVLEKIKQIPHSGMTEVMPGAVCEHEGHLQFGMTNTKGIWRLGQATNRDPIGLICSHILSTGHVSNIKIGALLSAGGYFHVGYQDIGDTEFKTDISNSSNRIATGAHAETQRYEIPKESQSDLVRGVELIAKPMASNTKVNVDYKLDNAAAYSDLGDIGPSNQDRPLKGINARAKTIQLKLNLTCSGNNSPEISQIRIY